MGPPGEGGVPIMVEDELIVLARQHQCPMITNDYNLGRVAELQGVSFRQFHDPP